MCTTTACQSTTNWYLHKLQIILFIPNGQIRLLRKANGEFANVSMLDIC